MDPALPVIVWLICYIRSVLSQQLPREASVSRELLWPCAIAIHTRPRPAFHSI
jgi:hypothetical protein